MPIYSCVRIDVYEGEHPQGVEMFYHYLSMTANNSGHLSLTPTSFSIIYIYV